MTLRVKYEETTAKFAGQFLVNKTADSIFLDVSSGPISDPSTSESLLPIHTRLALTPTSAQRLLGLLHQALASDSNSAEKKATTKEGGLPKLGKKEK